MLSFVTGPFGCGKTTQLLKLRVLAREQRISIAGIICPAVFEDGEKTGIDALLIPDENLLHLARRFTDDEIERESKWDFDAEVFTRINQHLDECKAQLLIIDELGPQEFILKRGFVSALRILDEGTYEDALVVIRPSLLEEAQKRWGSAMIIDVSKEGGLFKYAEILLRENRL